MIYKIKLHSILLLCSILSAHADQQSVLTAHFSGSWYPADPQELRTLLTKSEEDAVRQFAFPADAWQSPETTYQVFEAIDFGE